jgi:hypothetical protein
MKKTKRNPHDPHYVPPLSIYFVWHPADASLAKPLVDHCTAMLQRNIEKPFARAMNMPIFFRTSNSKNTPATVETLSKRTLVFIFVGKEVAADPNWVFYIQKILKNKDLFVIPIALDRQAFTLNNVFKGKNFIRITDFPTADSKDLFFIYTGHEIYRFGLNMAISKSKLGKDKAIKLFLSHSKLDSWAVELAKVLKLTIDTSTMRSFFDAQDIAPAYKFDSEIIGHLNESTLVAIHSDTYSSRYWCQRETMSAKASKRPILAVDCLSEFEDRRFSYSANVPAIHAGSEVPVSRQIILKILGSALLETIRISYNILLLKAYQEAGWFSHDSVLLPRPPEPIDVLAMLKRNGKKLTVLHSSLVYPEPSVYIEEHESLQNIGIRANTPLTYDAESLAGQTIGISISNPTDEELTEIGHESRHLVQLSQDIARHILGRKGKLAYGGDLRPDGFTQFIFDEAAILQDRMKTKTIHVDNYIAWPIFLRDSEEVKSWKANFREMASMIELQPPRDVLDLIPSLNSFMPRSTTENHYVWSRSLTNMRQQMIRQCTARVCAGGKHQGYSGIMPGILEEILIAIQLKKPLFLLGGFGGLTNTICNILAGSETLGRISYDWQIQHNTGYKDLLDYVKAKNKKYLPDYKVILGQIVAYGHRNLSQLNGLSVADNIKLSKTPFVDEALNLVLKGLKTIS